MISRRSRRKSNRVKFAASVFVALLVLGLVAPSSVKAGELFGPSAAETSSSKSLSSAEYDLDYATTPMPDLRVTVSQTKDLTSQGILVSWTGGKPSVRPSGGAGGQNFMQIFQCWGDDPNRPGHPDRTTCQYGGFATVGSARDYTRRLSDVDPQDLKYTYQGSGFVDPPYTSIPFNSATGEQVWSLKRNASNKLVRNLDADMANNAFYSKNTTNEITFAGSDNTGAGTAKFEVQTTSQSPGLGCGNAKRVGGKFVGQSCWLVVLPRGVADNGVPDTSQSGLFWDAWKHHLAFKLDFRPVGVRCDLGIPERQVQGSELISGAFSSWQPDLCSGSVKSAFVISSQFDADATESATGTDPSPLAITSRASVDKKQDPLVYAPIAVGGVSISFAIDRTVSQSMTVPRETILRDQTPFTSMKLTPRLVAKLLTASYTESLPVGANISYVAGNPANLTRDPDFLQVNADQPDWQYMNLHGSGISDVLMPAGRSYLAERVWDYVMSDRDARDYLAGKPDPWGMKVNKWYSTDAKINPNGVPFSLPAVSFPKSDPVEKPDNHTESGGSGLINLVTWRPYVSDFESGASYVLRGNALELGAWNPGAVVPSFQKPTRDLPGSQKVLGITTTVSAEQFQTFQVSLQNPSGQFVDPNQASMSAALNAMTPSKLNPEILEFDFGSDQARKASNAYPLTVPLYAAINPLQTDAVERAAFANLIEFAAAKGQRPGTNLGQLPPGYTPISGAMKTQALKAAKLIREGVSPLEQPSENNNNSDQEIDSPTTPVPSQKPTVIAAGVTPKDPNIPLTAGVIPVGVLLVICVSIFHLFVSVRKSQRK